MNAARILSKATSLGVSLRLDGDLVRIRGPRDARETILAAVAANKSEIMAYLRRAANDTVDLSRYPVADGGGPYSPYVVPMSPERVAGLLNDLRANIGNLADMERWTDAQRAQLLELVARQPVASLSDDLEYFRARLKALHAKKHAAEVLARTCNATPSPEVIGHHVRC